MELAEENASELDMTSGTEFKQGKRTEQIPAKPKSQSLSVFS